MNDLQNDPRAASKPTNSGEAQSASEVEQLYQRIGPLSRVPMVLSVEIGRGRLKIREILAMRFQSIVALNKPAGSPLDVRVNGILVAHGEPAVTENRIGIKINEVVGNEN